MTVLYPSGYGTTRVPMAELERRHKPKMHPEMWRRLEAWLISEGGAIGIGGGWRSTATQLKNWLRAPRTFARPGNSFHETQTWSTGLEAYAAVDLVVGRGGTFRHRSPSWAETESAKLYGLHTFVNNEPWHMQPRETRGVTSWKRDGRKDLGRWPLPTSGDPYLPPRPSTTWTEDIVQALPILRLGSTEHEHVLILQAILVASGATQLATDGDFGPLTEDVVKWTQAINGLVADGIVGPLSWATYLKVTP